MQLVRGKPGGGIGDTGVGELHARYDQRQREGHGVAGQFDAGVTVGMVGACR